MASQKTVKPDEGRDSAPKLRRVERKFSSKRKSAEVVRGLLQAHNATA